jgi:cytochrome c-type biogenesis protein
MDGLSIPVGLAFLAGLVSFLSPCVLPIVPSYLAFVTGLTFDELRAAPASGAWWRAAVHAGLFVIGFSLLFIALGASATALGAALRRSLPLLQQIGGVLIVVFGLYLLGVLRIPALMRERRIRLASSPVGKLGSLLAGVAFGAGWTPCVGPVLASVLLYASFEETMLRGTLLLAAYALGLGIPFFVSAVALNRVLFLIPKLRRWLMPMERLAGVALIVVGAFLFSGHFAELTAMLAPYAPLIEVGP